MTASRTPRSAGSREKLLRAAAEELAATGELEVAAVTRRAGVSTGLPYRYFGTRSGLLIAVLDDFYERLGEAAALREYAAATWAEREQRRIDDWVAFLYAEPLAPVVLGGLVGDAEVAAANARRLHALIELGARNMARGQHAGELPADRDPELLAAATLGGTHALISTALTRTPRPPAEELVGHLWTFVSGAVGLTSPPSSS
ncbi:TetR/AcrR family transcriptional regulator [Streptomyces lincolnensis]|uniref:TetR/AcrR family transcriptional regulator n=1 Tax=Streptomyces lincolnensis TaxID=1915 RepID=UPI001E5CC802|nr:TetR/AcrR family transcriptional regulator [Streptomyces lincolnensis]MCD7437029.1 TetR/AcrR family transcriptional regulator [Streptomyces lincolnensis]